MITSQRWVPIVLYIIRTFTPVDKRRECGRRMWREIKVIWQISVGNFSCWERSVETLRNWRKELCLYKVHIQIDNCLSSLMIWDGIVMINELSDARSHKRLKTSWVPEGPEYMLINSIERTTSCSTEKRHPGLLIIQRKGMRRAGWILHS